MNARPIGVFDSGLGGLTVLRALRDVLPHESLLYLGDTARVPYGNKSAVTVTRYSLEIADFLAGQQIKALVVACNTASALALPTLSAHCDFPVIGMIAPAAEAALEVSATKRICVLGTTATIGSRAYDTTIGSLCAQAQVFSQACPLFVPLVEEGWAEDDVTTAIVRRYLAPLLAHQVDALILGCTHYPLLVASIREVVGTRVTCVDTGAAAAQSLRQLLATHNLLAPPDAPVAHRLFVTDKTPQFAAVAQRLLRDALPPVEMINL